MLHIIFINVIIKVSNNFVTYSSNICINRMLIVILNANNSYCMLISVTHLKMKIKIKSIRNLVLLLSLLRRGVNVNNTLTIV